MDMEEAATEDGAGAEVEVESAADESWWVVTGGGQQYSGGCWGGSGAG